MLKTCEYDKLLLHKALAYLRIAIITKLCSETKENIKNDLYDAIMTGLCSLAVIMLNFMLA